MLRSASTASCVSGSNHRNEWIAILGAFAEGMGADFDLPELDGDDIAFRMYCATGGLIGYLTKTLRQTVWNAIDANTRVISLKDIEAAHQDAIWSRENLSYLPNPFNRSNLFYPTEEIIAQTKLIGTPSFQVPVKQTRVRTKPQLASSVLVR